MGARNWLNLKQVGHLLQSDHDPDEWATRRLRTPLRTPDYVSDSRALLEQEKLD